jgi:hypothetical protein
VNFPLHHLNNTYDPKEALDVASLLGKFIFQDTVWTEHDEPLFKFKLSKRKASDGKDSKDKVVKGNTKMDASM